MKRKTLIAFRVTFAALIAAVLSGCIVVTFYDFNAVTGIGEPENYEFNTGRFSGIKTEGFCNININYYSAESDTVTLTIQPNLREYYKIEVVDSDLVVRSTKRLNFKSGKNPVLTVSTPVLNRLIIEGACIFKPYDEIVSDSLAVTFRGAVESRAEINVNKLFVDISGAGKIELSGRADSADFTMSGAGDVDARSLLTSETNVKFSGAGSLRINCSKSLSINANGVGTIEYSGNPSVTLEKNGLVEIRRIN